VDLHRYPHPQCDRLCSIDIISVVTVTIGWSTTRCPINCISNKYFSESQFAAMKLSSFAARFLTWVAGAGLLLRTSVSAKAILGVDLGSLYMKVALVQRGAPLEIVTNMHSKRMTEQMILFDQGTRFYGADASSLLARKSTSTPVGMSIMLGRDEDHPAVKVRDKATRNFGSGLVKYVFCQSCILLTRNLSPLFLICFRSFLKGITHSYLSTMKHEKVCTFPSMVANNPTVQRS
jgi:hypothetical protein